MEIPFDISLLLLTIGFSGYLLSCWLDSMSPKQAIYPFGGNAEDSRRHIQGVWIPGIGTRLLYIRRKRPKRCRRKPNDDETPSTLLCERNFNITRRNCRCIHGFNRLLKYWTPCSPFSIV